MTILQLRRKFYELYCLIMDPWLMSGGVHLLSYAVGTFTLQDRQQRGPPKAETIAQCFCRLVSYVY